MQLFCKEGLQFSAEAIKYSASDASSAALYHNSRDQVYKHSTN
jgi:hypothetical protein